MHWTPKPLMDTIQIKGSQLYSNLFAFDVEIDVEPTFGQYLHVALLSQTRCANRNAHKTEAKRFW